MPHLIIEHSVALPSEIRITDLLSELHECLGSLKRIKHARVKSRVIPCEHCLVGKRVNQAQFIHVTVLLLEGRSAEDRHRLGEKLFRILRKRLEPYFQDLLSGAVTLEVREMKKEAYFSTALN